MTASGSTGNYAYISKREYGNLSNMLKRALRKNIFTKSSILDVSQGSEYTSVSLNCFRQNQVAYLEPYQTSMK